MALAGLAVSKKLTVSTPLNITSIAWPLASSAVRPSLVSKYDNTETTKMKTYTVRQQKIKMKARN